MTPEIKIEYSHTHKYGVFNLSGNQEGQALPGPPSAFLTSNKRFGGIYRECSHTLSERIQASAHKFELHLSEHDNKARFASTTAGLSVPMNDVFERDLAQSQHSILQHGLSSLLRERRSEALIPPIRSQL